MWWARVKVSCLGRKKSLYPCIYIYTHPQNLLNPNLKNPTSLLIPQKVLTFCIFLVDCVPPFSNLVEGWINSVKAFDRLCAIKLPPAPVSVVAPPICRQPTLTSSSARLLGMRIMHIQKMFARFDSLCAFCWYHVCVKFCWKNCAFGRSGGQVMGIFWVVMIFCCCWLICLREVMMAAWLWICACHVEDVGCFFVD